MRQHFLKGDGMLITPKWPTVENGGGRETKMWLQPCSGLATKFVQRKRGGRERRTPSIAWGETRIFRVEMILFISLPTVV
jgi:hypothetical protein